MLQFTALPLAMLLGLTISIAAMADTGSPKPNDATLGASAPEGATVLFDGENLDDWSNLRGEPAEWPVSGELFTVGAGKGSIRTRQTFGDCRIHLEFNVPYMPDKTGQARGNSGVYVNGRYEIQVLDSYGLEPKTNDCGAIYQQVAPSVNACKPPLQWQTYDIIFRKPRVEDGQVTERARITVIHNGIKIIDDQEIDETPGGVGGVKLGEDGPLMLQDHGDLVQFRNIWIMPLKD